MLIGPDTLILFKSIEFVDSVLATHFVKFSVLNILFICVLTSLF